MFNNGVVHTRGTHSGTCTRRRRRLTSSSRCFVRTIPLAEGLECCSIDSLAPSDRRSRPGCSARSGECGAGGCGGGRPGGALRISFGDAHVPRVTGCRHPQAQQAARRRLLFAMTSVGSTPLPSDDLAARRPRGSCVNDGLVRRHAARAHASEHDEPAAVVLMEPSRYMSGPGSVDLGPAMLHPLV